MTIALNPFPGPRPYRGEDHDYFFGRRQVCRSIVHRILAYRCLTLFGSSGSGKSSLLQAGVIFSLARDHDHRTVSIDAWPAARQPRSNAPGDDAAGSRPMAWLRDRLREQLGLSTGASGSLDDLLVAAEDHSDQPVFLCLDQMEQLLLRAPDDLAELLEALGDALASGRAGLKVLFAVREDYLGRLREKMRGHPRLREHTFRLGPLTVDEMTEAACSAVRKATRERDWHEDALRSYLVNVRVPGQDRTGDAEIQTAFAQIVCRDLWARNELVMVAEGEEAPSEKVTKKILYDYLESTLVQLGPQGRTIADKLLNQLIGKDGSRTLLTEAAARASFGQVGIDVLEALGTSGVVMSEAHQGSRYFEIGHDWLAMRVFEHRKENEKLRKRTVAKKKSRDQEKALAVKRRRIAGFVGVGLLGVAYVQRTCAAQDLEEQQRLTAESKLAEARASAQARRAAPRAKAREYLARGMPERAARYVEASEADDSDREWKQLAYDVLSRRAPTRVKSIGVDAAIDDGGAWLATFDGKQSVRIVHLASGAERVMQCAGKVRSLSVARDGTTVAFVEGRGAFVWKPKAGQNQSQEVSCEGRFLPGSETLVWVVVSPGGEYVAGLLGEGLAGLWPLAAAPSGPAFLKKEQHHHRATTFAFQASPVGDKWSDQRLAVGYDDGDVRLYRLPDGSRSNIHPHEHRIGVLRFNRDGTRLLSAATQWAGAPVTARVIVLDGKTPPIDLVGHEDDIVDADFDPTGNRVVTASTDRTARVWNLESVTTNRSLRPSMVLTMHHAELSRSRFSPDGTRVLTVAKDETPRLWNVVGQRSAIGQPLEGHARAVRDAAFDDNGQIVTWAGDGTVRWWPVARKDEVVASFRWPARWAQIDGAGTQMVVALESGGATEIDLRTGEVLRALPARGEPVSAVSLDLTARRIAVGGPDGGAGVWTGESYEPLPSLDAGLSFVSFSPAQESVLLTSATDGLAVVWNTTKHRPTAVLRGHTKSVRGAFGATGRLIATASWDGTSRLWRRTPSEDWGPDGGTVVHSSPDAKDPVRLTSVAVSGDETRVAVGTADGAVYIHRVQPLDPAQELPVPLTGHEGPVSSVAFDDQRGRIVTASEDTTVRVWEGSESIEIRGHEGAVHTAMFGTDGQWVFSASADGTVRRWPLTYEKLLRRLRGRLDECLPQAERTALGLPGDDAFKQCQQALAERANEARDAGAK
jgi:WD40 repeat protein